MYVKTRGLRPGALVRGCELWAWEERQLQSWSVMANSVSTGLCHQVPRYSVKHYSECVWVFLDEINA